MTTFQTEQCKGFFTHWKSLRAEGDVVPQQSEFLDNPHPGFAPHLHIAEFRNGRLIFRLIGTKLVERWGRDKTGEIVGDGQPAEMQQSLYRNSWSAISKPCGFRMNMKFAASTGAQFSVEAVVLPLQVKAGKPNRLVSYSEVVEKLKYGDQSQVYLGIPEVEWIDVGAGVPDHTPTTVQL
ncbi:MAG: PAS domain-containing protein [Alphaproteobacteria bacterium]|nr:PAS domain-containing protein [Alphaproteobacteria bacterium]